MSGTFLEEEEEEAPVQAAMAVMVVLTAPGESVEPVLTVVEMVVTDIRGLGMHPVEEAPDKIMMVMYLTLAAHQEE
jgi:hypothetical protein